MNRDIQAMAENLRKQQEAGQKQDPSDQNTPTIDQHELNDQVDKMNEAAYYSLSILIKDQPALTAQALNALVIARNLERVADHATNIAEDVIFWVRGADVRHHQGDTQTAAS